MSGSPLKSTRAKTILTANKENAYQTSPSKMTEEEKTQYKIKLFKESDEISASIKRQIMIT